MATKPKGKQITPSNKTPVQNPKSGQKPGTTQSKKVEELQRELKNCQTENAQLRAKFNPDEVQKELAKVGIFSQDQLGLLTEHNRRLIDENTKLTSGMKLDDSEVQGEVKRLKKELAELNSFHGPITKRNNEIQDENDQLKKKIDDLSKQQEESSNHRPQEDTIKQLQETITKLREEIDQLTTKCRNLEDVIVTNKETISSLKNERENQRKDDAGVEQLKMDKGRMERENENMKKELETARENKRKNDADVEHLKADKKRLERENEKLNQDLDNVRTQRDDASKGKQDTESKRQNTTIQSLEEDIKASRGISEKLEQEVNSLNEDKKKLQEIIEKLEGESKLFKERHAAEVEQLKNDKEKAEQELEDMNKSFEDAGEKHTAEVEQLKKVKETAEQAMEDMKKKLEDAGQQLQNLKKKQNSTPQISDESTRKERDKLKADLDDARSTIDTLKKEKSEHEFQISELKNTCHNAFEKQRKTDVKLEKLIDEHKKLVERKDETIQKLRKENNMVDTAPSGPSVAKVKELEKENHDLKTRLSEMISAQLTNNNPDIADLSDENRPQKLGEMYSELYDNEWTDAFEEIQQKKGSEQASIAFLRETLQEAYTFCQKLSSEYRAQVSKGVLTFNSKKQIMDDTKLPPTLKRLLVDLMKKVSPYLKEGVANKFLDKAGKAGDSEKTFRKKCAALCWLMTMQDPAVALITDSSTGEFNTDQFRVYTKRGTTVDYVVWPPLQLHTGGPLIAKGVAQGK